MLKSAPATLAKVPANRRYPVRARGDNVFDRSTYTVFAAFGKGNPQMIARGAKRNVTYLFRDYLRNTVSFCTNTFDYYLFISYLRFF